MCVHGLGDCNGVNGDSEARGGAACIVGLGVMLIPVTADGAPPRQMLVPLCVGELLAA